ncbi:MAG TPA: hypothetical protein VE422_15150 [Terriglobia bacterium]|nr:hypothetical protein [Terriglobia bacterium]
MSEERSPISRLSAFLIHLRAGTRVAGDRLVGRVEHVASGRAEHFTNEEQLWAFVLRTLNHLEDKTRGEILPENDPLQRPIISRNE